MREDIYIYTPPPSPLSTPASCTVFYTPEFSSLVLFVFHVDKSYLIGVAATMLCIYACFYRRIASYARQKSSTVYRSLVNRTERFFVRNERVVSLSLCHVALYASRDGTRFLQTTQYQTGRTRDNDRPSREDRPLKMTSKICAPSFPLQRVQS